MEVRELQGLGADLLPWVRDLRLEAANRGLEGGDGGAEREEVGFGGGEGVEAVEEVVVAKEDLFPKVG